MISNSVTSHSDNCKRMSVLDITGDDIAQLRDDEFRSLIGLLCEADYRSAGLTTRGIAWGGHQDAADGGVDVAYWGMLTEKVEPPSNAFIPRKDAVIQVKLNGMTPSKIVQEMRPRPKDEELLKKHPKGILRQSIKNLIPLGGAYIIVSAKTDAAGVRLSERIEAMRDAVASDDPDGCLFVNFLDQGQVANWVRNHPSLISWVRNKIGRALQGWKPYENWANPRGGVEEEYLLDDGLRLHDGTSSTSGILSVQDGLLRLRSKLSLPGSSVRLVGLSGVGKTRLVQALFDERIGEQPLASSLAIYTDIADSSPSPEPGAMAEQLLALRSRAILIVDNCPPDLHRRLTKACTQPNSTVSLLTVEYDVRDDLPEETSVFKLEPASEEIISKLIQKRFPDSKIVYGEFVTGLDEDDFIVMIVGGPNARTDYHIDEGPEFFYQLEGEMLLRTVQDGERVDIPIGEGEILLLPPRVPHSPQRFADTVGLVVERARLPHELDGFMWFCDECSNKLYEEFVYVDDIVAFLEICGHLVHDRKFDMIWTFNPDFRCGKSFRNIGQQI